MMPWRAVTNSWVKSSSSADAARIFLGSTPGQPDAEMFPESDTEFFLKVVDAQITFVKDSSGKAVKLIFNDYDMKFAAPRAKDKAEAKVENSFAIR